MSQKRKDPPPATPAAEPEPAAPPVAKPERSMLLWQVAGGVFLAVVAFVGVAVYQNLWSQLKSVRAELGALSTDLRKDLGRLGEGNATMVKKEDHSTRLRTVWDNLKELRADRNDLTTLQERSVTLTELYKAGEEERRRMLAEVKQLRQSTAAGDEKQALLREIRAIRERIAHIEGGKRPAVVPAGHAEEQEKK